MTRFVIHNHLPKRAKDGGREVSREQEEKNRDRMYKDTGIKRVARDDSKGEVQRLRAELAKIDSSKPGALKKYDETLAKLEKAEKESMR